MNRFRHFLPFALFAIALVAAQLGLRAAGMEYCLTQLTMSLYYAIVVIGLCLVMGYAGQVSLGHGGFFAIGGYTSAVLTTYNFAKFEASAWVGLLKQAHIFVVRDDAFGNPALNVSPWAAFLAAMLLTFVVANLVGYPALRLKGHYLAMATLGFGLIVNKLVLGSALTGSADGINGVPPWHLGFGLTVSGKSALRVENYYIAGVLVLALLVLLRNLIQSRVGRALQAIHDRETAANAMGINTAAYKLRAFVLSALLAAMAGAFFTHYTGGIGPSEAGALKSVRYVALAAAGGMASLWGVTGMSTVLNYLSLRGLFGSYDNAVFGTILILIVSLAPEGPLKPLGLWIRKLIRPFRRPLDEDSGPPHRSADSQSAVSPICNRQGDDISRAAGIDCRPAESNSAIQQTASLRYDREVPRLDRLAERRPGHGAA
jgi:branched-chain amino acid transport system permease protein